MGAGERNLELARLLYVKAEGDLESARVLFKAARFADSVYHCQQAAEKAVKSILILKGVEVREHIVSGYFSSEIVSFAEPDLVKELREVVRTLVELEEHLIRTRYPRVSERYIWNPEVEYRTEDGERALDQAQRVLQILERYARLNFGVKLKG